MKKLLLLASVIPVLTTTVGNAQPRKGDWMVGANVIPFSLKGGYFLSDRLAVGTELLINGTYSPAQKTIAANIGASPFIRYYFASKDGMKANRFYFFGDVNFTVGYGFSIDNINNQKSSNEYYKTGIAPGLVYLINNKVSFDGALRFNYYAIGSAGNSHIGTTYELGIQVFLAGRKKATQRD